MTTPATAAETQPEQTTEAASIKRTPPKRKARQLAKHLREERPDYAYLKTVFAALRVELNVEVEREPKKLPYVPTEEEIRSYYKAVWDARRSGDVVLIKTLLYTGVRVAELVCIHLDEVDLDAGPLPPAHHRRQGRQGPLRAFPRLVQVGPRAAHQGPAQGKVVRSCSSCPGRSPTPTVVYARSSPGTARRLT